jgi:hypothetical protein
MKPEEISVKLQEIQDMKLELDTDPVSVGLEVFNEKLSQLDAFTERVSELHQEALAYKGIAEVADIEADAAYEQAYAAKLATTKTLQDMKSTDLRRAHLDAELCELVSRKTTAAKELALANIYLRRIQQKSKYLDGKTKRLYTQLDVVKQLLKLDPQARENFLEPQIGKRDVILK